MDASEDIALVLAELRALSSEDRTIKNKQILQETVLQTMQHVALSLPAVISDTIMNYPTITNTVASNSIHECPTTTIDLQVDRGNVIHNHTEEVPVYGFQLPPFMATTMQIRFFPLALKTISYTKLKIEFIELDDLMPALPLSV